ncbi:DUF397 domain-containing protein [Streptomyces sp. B6B3]|uniref:DUF397 domain-containing protein n=1 Tax=Streptomyces sp. B6B3 TaxID=3153570 RepID=UPI00325E2C5A
MRPFHLSTVAWRKSSYSNSDGGECVEVAAHLWHKSSYSNQDGGACVEVAGDLDAVVPVRDSKKPHGAVLAFSSGGWAAFLCAVKGDGLGV